MGQQQLILLVLAVVIVAIATVVGIRAFTENQIKSNADAMMQDAVRMASDAQAWKQKPAPFGGQAAADSAAATTTNNFTGITLARLGYKDDGAGNYLNLNGTFTVAATGTDGALITGNNTNHNNTIQVVVCGITDVDVNGAITLLGGQTGDATPTC